MGALGRRGSSLIERWSPGDGVDRVLVVAAHPDDVDFGAAGTVAAFTDAGVDVAYCIVTDGDAGGNDRTIPRAEMAAIRRSEQRNAAAVVGVGEVTFLGYPDGRLTPSLELRRDLSRVIRRFRPQRMLAPSPDRMWDRLYASHPDHLAAGEAAACAFYPDAQNPFSHPELLEEGLEPHTVRELWLMATHTTTLAVETTASFDRKVEALMCHRSQVGEAHDLPARLRGWAMSIAGEAGMPEGTLAEGFQVVRTG